MINKGLVLKFIRENVAYSFQPIELTDEDIWSYLADFTIPEFSYYWPDVTKMYIKLGADNKTEVPNEWLIIDPLGMQLFGIVEFVGSSSLAIKGHPIFGNAQRQAPEYYVYRVVKTGPQWVWGWDTYTYEFIPPNRLRISGISPGDGVLIYERMHPLDLHTILPSQERWFLRFCLADTKIRLGSLRKKFQNLTTPYGEIPISADIGEEGKTEKAELIDKLDQRIYNIYFDVG